MYRQRHIPFEISGNVTILLRDRLYVYRQRHIPFEISGNVRSDYFTHILQSIARDIFTFEFQEMYVVTASLREYKLPHGSPTTGYIFKKGETGNVFALRISLVSLRDRLHVYILQCIATDIFPLNLQRI